MAPFDALRHRHGSRCADVRAEGRALSEAADASADAGIHEGICCRLDCGAAVSGTAGPVRTRDAEDETKKDIGTRSRTAYADSAFSIRAAENGR